ncbi:MAG: hypothetical protein DRJ03_05600 [Chloroflexi bacterium]|nr:MAG: hypothetical protein DRI81_00925 [Chloroflexota bacterium]RLC87589.1 MAG: hypothetical protein DRJ03_05600 [Chloroflexota bacterium]
MNKAKFGKRNRVFRKNPGFSLTKIPEIAVVVVLSLLLVGCSNQATPGPVPAAAVDQMPLMLAQPLLQAGYEAAGYYELDANDDGLVEALAVLTIKLPLEQSYLGDSYAMLFSQRGGAWSLTDSRQLDGVNGSAELRDLSGDGFPELLIFTEEGDSQLGDFVTPLHYTDHLIVFTYEPDSYLTNLGTFSSRLSGVMRPRTTVGEWGGQPAIQTARDIPATGSPLLQPYRVETFAWQGQEGFVSVQAQEQQRISPIVLWLARSNGPWAAASLILGGILSLTAITIARRLRLRERWFILGIALLLVAGGIGLGTTQEWLCAPALIMVGLAGLWIGRQMAARLISQPYQDSTIENEE